MKVNFNILPYSIKEPTIIYKDIYNQKEKYPIACIGKDSYISNGLINTGLEFTINHGYTAHNIQIGKFNSLAEGIEFCMGINHEYTRICMGVSKLFEDSTLNLNYNQK